MIWLFPLLIAKFVLDYLTVKNKKIKMKYEIAYFFICCLAAIIMIHGSKSGSDDFYLSIGLVGWAVFWLGIAYFKTRKS